MSATTVSSRLPDAVQADPPDEAVAGHYGQPLHEQRSLDSGQAWVDRSHRGVVVVSGPDRLSWLHALTTQHLAQLGVGVPTETLVLSPHGHVEHAADVVDDGTRTWLLVGPGAAPALVGFLESMRFLTRVEVQDASAQWATFTVPRAACPAIGAAIGVAIGAAIGPARPSRVVPDAVDLLVPRAGADVAAAALSAAGLAVAGHDAYEALRIAAGVARPGLDTDHRTLVHEAGLVEPAVHLDKGCYRGQETVARVHNLGRPPRRLVLVHLDGSEAQLPARGTPIVLDGRTVGTLTSVARHFELGPIGLALVRRSVPDTAQLWVGEVVAAVDRDVSSPTAPVDLGALRS